MDSSSWKLTLLQYYMKYVISLNENPLLTKSATAAVLNFSEEFVAQSLTFRNGINYSWVKMFKLSGYGFFVGAPLGHICYDLMNRFVPGNGITGQLLQLGVSNFVILPIQTFFYIVAMGLIDDLGMDDLKKLLRQTFFPIMITSWKYFPLIQIFVFKYVNPALWVPLFNLIGLIFGIWVNATTKKKRNINK